MLEIKAYQSGDAAALRALLDGWGEELGLGVDDIAASAEALLAQPGHGLWLAWESGELLGYAQTSLCHELIFKPSLELCQLLVAEAWRGRGVGQALMARVEDQARSLGAGTVKLSSQLHREAAHRFYEKLGYAPYKVSKYYQKILA